MSDYKEQVNSLREHADLIETSIELYGPSATRLLVYDLRNAAAAIEELDAEETRLLLLTSDLQDNLMDLQAQLPKQGEWEQVEVIGYDGNSMNDDAVRCSACGHVEQSVYWARTYYHYCPNCGAKMEVQE